MKERLENELLHDLALGQKHQALLCGHLWLANHLPSLPLFEFLQALVTNILPTTGIYNPEGLASAQELLHNPKTHGLLNPDHVTSMLCVLDGLSSHLNSLVHLPIKPHPTLEELLKDYFRMHDLESGVIHQAVLHSLLSPFKGAPYLDFFLHTRPERVYLAAINSLQMTSLPKQFVPLLCAHEEDFSLFFDPEKALYLGCFQAIFRYLNLPQQPLMFLRGPMMLGETLLTMLGRVVDRPDWFFRRITRCYQVMKCSPVLHLLKLQTTRDKTMKILSQTFQIDCNETPLNARTPGELIKVLEGHKKERWAMLKTPRELYLLELPTPSFNLYQKIVQLGKSYLKTPVSEITLAQILLRLCENQTAFNQKIKQLMTNLPMTKGALMQTALSWSNKEERESIKEVIDQELSKIFFNEEMCLKILTQLPLELQKNQQIELIHELMLAIGSANEYPIRLARIIQRVLINQEVKSPCINLITNTICKVAKRPGQIPLGHINEREGWLILGYHFSLQRPELFLVSGKEMQHLDFMEFSNCSIITTTS